MLDIRFIRENPDLVEEKSRQKGYKVDIKHLLQLDEQRRDLLKKVEEIRKERNELAAKLKETKPSSDDIAKGKTFKKKLSELEKELDPIGIEFQDLLKKVPNMPADDVPVGASEEDNVVTKTVGDKPEFGFTPRSHWEIAEARGLIDKERAAKVAGARFVYIMGDLVKLQMAIMQFVFDTLTDEEVIKKVIQDNKLNVIAKPFIPVLPPAMIRTSVYEAMDRLEPSEDRYRVGSQEDDLWLQGSAEHTLGPMFMNEELPAESLPLRYIGFLTSFRREAGSYGKDTEGIIRLHQFDKLEMESFCAASTGMDEHLFLIAIQEYLMQQLRLPYHVLTKCTADIGKPNARGIDLEAWMPGQDKYRETHTADYMTDYQARRLGTKVRLPEGGSDFVHTNDATALAIPRTLVAIIENYQNEDGTIRVPDVLQKYMGGAASI